MNKSKLKAPWFYVSFTCSYWVLFLVLWQKQGNIIHSKVRFTWNFTWNTYKIQTKNLVYGVSNVLVSAECVVVTDFIPPSIFHIYYYSSEKISESILIVALDDGRYLQAFNYHEMYLTGRINVVKMYSAALIFLFVLVTFILGTSLVLIGFICVVTAGLLCCYYLDSEISTKHVWRVQLTFYELMKHSNLKYRFHEVLQLENLSVLPSS